MPGKLKLNIEELEVESFPVQQSVTERGTVHGFITDAPQVCISEDGGFTCDASCNHGSCDGTCNLTCDNTCGYSCGFTCGHTCGATCGPTCDFTCNYTCNNCDLTTWGDTKITE